MTDHYLREKKRFIIELLTGVSLEKWEANNERLKAIKPVGGTINEN